MLGNLGRARSIGSGHWKEVLHYEMLLSHNLEMSERPSLETPQQTEGSGKTSIIQSGMSPRWLTRLSEQSLYSYKSNNIDLALPQFLSRICFTRNSHSLS